MNNNINNFMSRAIELSIDSVRSNGGPFGCVIVKNNKIIAEGYNKVTKLNDPTAHGEIVAIRNACKSLKTFNLEGTQLYTSCEPCPMCLSAIYWAHIEKIYFGNTRSDAAEIGFDDEFIYKEFTKNQKLRKIQMNQILKKEAKIAFNLWKENPDKIEY